MSYFEHHKTKSSGNQINYIHKIKQNKNKKAQGAQMQNSNKKALTPQEEIEALELYLEKLTAKIEERRRYSAKRWPNDAK